jgi:hypothetical protein
MRILKGTLISLGAALLGGALLCDSVLDIALFFFDFSYALVGWSFAISAAVCGAITGVLYFREPKV